MMMLKFIKQHLSNTWSSIHEKVKQDWGWAEKGVANKKTCIFICWVSIMSYANNNPLYVCSDNVDVTLEKPKEVRKVLFEWFSNNFLKANAHEC